jgi:hypothetical protein
MRLQAQTRPWSAGRAFGRAAVGAFVAVMLQFFVLLLMNPTVNNDSVVLAQLDDVFSATAIPFTILSGLLALAAEGLVKPLRLPDGSAYRFVRNNRWLAAGITGAVMGLLIGVLAESIAIYNTFGVLDGTAFELVFYAAIAWILAEVPFGRRRAAAGPAGSAVG